VLKYLNGTKYLQLKLSVDNLGMLKWYIDGSHNAHWDCKGHGGVVFRMGKGVTLMDHIMLIGTAKDMEVWYSGWVRE
jgi:hypothetical protein